LRSYGRILEKLAEFVDREGRVRKPRLFVNLFEGTVRQIAARCRRSLELRRSLAGDEV
jgi:hypothetical protein